MNTGERSTLRGVNVKRKITVIGGCTTELTMAVDGEAKCGAVSLAIQTETVVGGCLNIAISARRMGADVAVVGKLGEDVYGDAVLDFCRKQGIATEYISRTINAKTGVSSVTVNAKTGEHSCVISLGASLLLSEDDVSNAEARIAESDVVVIQNSIPKDAVYTALCLAEKHNVSTLLSLSPTLPLPRKIIKMAEYVTVDVKDVEYYFDYPTDGKKSAIRANQLLFLDGFKNVIILCEEDGAVYWGEHGYNCDCAIKGDRTDTSGARDAFNGALAVSLAEGEIVTNAIDLAAASAAAAVMRFGTSSSMPDRMDADDMCLKAFDKEHYM